MAEPPQSPAPAPRPLGRWLHFALFTILWLAAVALFFSAQLRDLWRGDPPPAPGPTLRESLNQLARRTAGITPGTENAWPQFSAALDAMARAGATEPDPPSPTAPGQVVYGACIDAAFTQRPAPAELSGADADKARRLLAACESEGVEAAIDDLIRRGGRAAIPIADAPITQPLPVDFTAARGASRILAFRFALEYRAGNDDQAILALRRSIAISNVLLHQPIIIARLVGVAMIDTALTRLRAEFTARPPSESTALAAITEINRITACPLTEVLRGEELASLDLIERQDSSIPRMGERPARAAGALREYYDVAVWAAGQSLQARTGAERANIHARLTEAASQSKTVEFLAPATMHFITADDRHDISIAGTLNLLAIHAHTARHGSPPDWLADIDPDIVRLAANQSEGDPPVLPPDPITEQPFAYRRIDAAADPAGRTWLLYSVGFDRVDNGGTQDPKTPIVALNPSPPGGIAAYSGIDFVFNQPDAPPSTPQPPAAIPSR